MSQPPDQPQLTEEQLRQIEAEMERITVDDVLLQTLVTLLNLAARKAGLATPPGEQGPPPDLEQMHQAIEGARAILPLVEQRHADQLGPVRDTLSQLQIAYSKLTGRWRAGRAAARAARARRPRSPRAPARGRPPGASGSPVSSSHGFRRGASVDCPRSSGGLSAAALRFSSSPRGRSARRDRRFN